MSNHYLGRQSAAFELHEFSREHFGMSWSELKTLAALATAGTHGLPPWVTAENVAERVGLSVNVVRRNLERLEGLGLARRVDGGRLALWVATGAGERRVSVARNG